MRPPVRGSRPQQPRGAADPSATRPAFMNNSGSEPNSPGAQDVSTKVADDPVYIANMYKFFKSLFYRAAPSSVVRSDGGGGCGRWRIASGTRMMADATRAT